MKNNQSKKEINKKNININIIIVTIIFVLAIIGISYAFFSYNRTGDENSKLIAGQIYLKLNEGTDSISLSTVFPMSTEEARKKSDNVLKFSISGVNTTKNKDIYYEIKLNEGIDINGMSRFNPEDLRFDLTEIIDGQKNLVVDNMAYHDLNNRKIWVNSVNHDTTDEINIEYELRMWLSDNVLISDTLPDASYTTGEYRNSYANVKVAVFGDFIEKNINFNHMNKDFGTEINNLKSDIKEIHFVSMDKTEINNRTSNALIVSDVTDKNKSFEGSVTAWIEEELVTNADSTTTQYYKMYVASEEIIFFPSDVSDMFNEWNGLTTINFDNVDTRYVTDMSYMFYHCESLEKLDVSNFDTSNVTTMESMFQGCTSITKLDLSDFDTSNVTNMHCMFNNTPLLKELDVSSFDTSNVTNMHAMFYKCFSLEKLDVSNFDTSKVTNMRLMFSECNSLSFIDVSDFNTANVNDMGSMFYNCYSIEMLDVSNFDTSNVTDMHLMFYNCLLLREIDVSNFNTANVIHFESMFSHCSGLSKLDVSGFNTAKAENMNYMFSQCEGLLELDLTSFVLNNVTTMIEMFDFCINLKTIYGNNDWSSANITDSSNMFRGCVNLVGKVPYNFNEVNISMANPDTGYFTRKDA